MEASINDDVSQKQSHQRVHFQLWDTCKDALAHLSAPGSFAWRLFLGALTLFPAGGRSQLTQCKMKLQEEPRLGLVYPSLICDTMTTHWKQKPYFYIFLSVSTYHVKRKKCFSWWRLLNPSGTQFEPFLSKQKLLTGFVSQRKRSTGHVVVHSATEAEYHSSVIGRAGTDGPMTATGVLPCSNRPSSTDPTW